MSAGKQKIPKLTPNWQDILNDTEGARDDAQSARDTAKTYRDSAKGFRDDSETNAALTAGVDYVNTVVTNISGASSGETALIFSNTIARFFEFVGFSWDHPGTYNGTSPRGLAVYDGDLYAANFGSDDISRWDGTSWDKPGTYNGTSPRGLAVYDGNLYVANRDSDDVSRWDGTSWDKPGTYNGMGPIGLAVYDGNLYVANLDSDDISRWDGSSWDHPGTYNGTSPIGLAVYDGDLYVANIDSDDISRWDGTSWDHPGTYNGTSPIGLAVYDGNLYVANPGSDDVSRWDGTSWDHPGTYNGAGPLGLAVYDGNLYVPNRDSDDVSRWGGWTQLGPSLSEKIYYEVTDLSKLKSLTPGANKSALVQSPADGGGGLYWWDTSGDAANADGVTRVASTVSGYTDGDVSEGLWRRIDGSTPTIQTPNGTTGTDIQQTLNQLSNLGGGICQLEPITYSVSESIFVPDNVIVQGEGQQVTIIEGDTNPTYVSGVKGDFFIPLWIGSDSTTMSSNVKVRDLTVIPNESAGSGNHFGIQALQRKNVTRSDRTEKSENVVVERVGVIDSKIAVGCAKTGLQQDYPILDANKNRNWVVRDCYIETTSNKAVELQEMVGGRIVNNYIEECYDGLQFIHDCEHCVMVGNTVKFERGGLLPASHRCQDIVCANNVIELLPNPSNPARGIYFKVDQDQNASFALISEHVTVVGNTVNMLASGGRYSGDTEGLVFGSNDSSVTAPVYWQHIQAVGNVFKGCGPRIGLHPDKFTPNVWYINDVNVIGNEANILEIEDSALVKGPRIQANQIGQEVTIPSNIIDPVVVNNETRGITDNHGGGTVSGNYTPDLSSANTGYVLQNNRGYVWAPERVVDGYHGPTLRLIDSSGNEADVDGDLASGANLTNKSGISHDTVDAWRTAEGELRAKIVYDQKKITNATAPNGYSDAPRAVQSDGTIETAPGGGAVLRWVSSRSTKLKIENDHFGTNYQVFAGVDVSFSGNTIVVSQRSSDGVNMTADSDGSHTGALVVGSTTITLSGTAAETWRQFTYERNGGSNLVVRRDQGAATNSGSDSTATEAVDCYIGYYPGSGGTKGCDHAIGPVAHIQTPQGSTQRNEVEQFIDNY